MIRRFLLWLGPGDINAASGTFITCSLVAFVGFISAWLDPIPVALGGAVVAGASLASIVHGLWWHRNTQSSMSDDVQE